MLKSRWTLVCLVVAAVGCAAGEARSAALPGGCPATPATFEKWRAVRADPDAAAADGLAIELTNCLASPDPELRDRIGYEVLTYWLRSERLSAETVEGLRLELVPWLGRRAPQWAYGRAFAALILSELVRHDHQARRWSADTLAGLLDAALAMLAAEDDYRGLDAESGWIHTVAHGSDLLWRLARHPATGPREHRLILDGVAGKVAPAGHAYVFNEPDRLARVVLAVAARQTLEPDALDDWIARFESPRHMGQWNEAFATPAGMAELHDTKGFLRALREAFRRAELSAHLPPVDRALTALP